MCVCVYIYIYIYKFFLIYELLVNMTIEKIVSEHNLFNIKNIDVYEHLLKIIILQLCSKLIKSLVGEA